MVTIRKNFTLLENALSKRSLNGYWVNSLVKFAKPIKSPTIRPFESYMLKRIESIMGSVKKIVYRHNAGSRKYKIKNLGDFLACNDFINTLVQV